MGQTPSNPTIATPSITRYSPKYHVIETKQDPHYGEVKIIVEDETKELQILKEISFSSQAAFDKELDYFTQRVQVSHPNIASILGFSSEVDNNAFPQSFTIKIFIEMLDKDLRQELQERIQAHKFLSESELLFICENIISALYHLETRGFSHGDIRPFNIFVSPKGYKLFDPSLSSLRNHSGIVNAIKHGLQVFLSPELLDQVPERKTEVTCNKFKADVFSLGVTLLSLASLTHGEDLYNYEMGRIDKMLLRQRLDVVKNQYSAFTHDLIKDMLTEEESERPNFKALHTKLLPYQDNIHQKTDLPFFKNKGLTKGEEAIIDPQSGHRVEYTRKPTGSGPQEHEKPGGIIINPEDAIPSKRDDLHKVFSERTHEVYYYQMLHPRTQGTNVVTESESNRGQEKPLKSQMQTQEKMEGPVREFDYQKTRVFEEKENLKMGGSHKDAQDILLTKEDKERIEKEHFRNQQREPIRTGSILINPDDVLPSMKESLHTYPRTGETYANLVSSSQIRERGGIVHGEPWTGVKEVDMQRPGPDTVQEPIKTGGILIHMFDVIPALSQSVMVDPHSGETFAQLKSDSQIREEQRGIVHAGMPQERELRAGAMHNEPIRSGSILINPEDVLPSMRESLQTYPRTGETYANLISSSQIREQGGNVHAGKPQERELRAGAMHNEPIRSGSILINPEDVLPSMRESLQTYPRTGETYANLSSSSQIRAQGGNIHAGKPQERELRAGAMQEQRESIRSGSILINPEDVLPSMRESLQTYPRTGETYANLTSSSQISQQGGIVHAGKPQERELRAGAMKPKREQIRTGSILIDPEDVLPSMRESLQTYPRTGETYANLSSSSQIEERGGIVHGGRPQEREQAKSSLSRDTNAPKTFSRQFAFEYRREPQHADPIKTGGIIIRKDDALSYMKDHIHRNPRNGVTYAMLKPWAQIKEEQAGITHFPAEVEEEKTSAMPVLETRIEEVKGVQEVDKNAFRTRSRMFNMEHERVIEEEDPIKTGGIVIHPDDVLPMHRLDVRTIPRSGLSYANLKPWMTIQREQAGIIHQVPLREARERHDLKKFSKKRSSLREGETMISSKRREVEQQEVVKGSSASSQKVAFRSRNQLIELNRERKSEFVSPRSMIIDHIRTAQPTRFIEPENMLSWVKKEPEPQAPGEGQESTRHHREPIKTGSILIHAEDVLPSEMDKLHTDPRTGETYAKLKSDAQIREEQGGIVHAPPEASQIVEREGQDIEMIREARVPEEKKAVTSSANQRVVSRYFCYEYEPRNIRAQEEPVKTGGILIHPYDAWPSFRESIVQDPRSRLMYVLLKPWNQVQKEQNGVIHSSSIHKVPEHLLRRKDRRASRRMDGQKEFEYQYSRENTSELMKNDENRQENVISYDKENISNLMNFQKASRPQGEFSKSSAVPLGEVSENVDQDSGFFKKQAEDQNKWLRLNDKVDNMLRKSRVILGESHLNTSQNVL